MKALLALVIVMGVLIVAGTATLVGVIVQRLSHPAARHVPAWSPASVPGGPDVMALLQHEPAGTRITSMVRQSDALLAIALSGGGPDRILLWDVPGGRAAGEIRLTP